MRGLCKRSLWMFAISLTLAPSLFSAPPQTLTPLTLETIALGHGARQAAISPDGEWVAVTANGRPGSGIYLVSTRQGELSEPKFWVAGGSPAWSPDSRRIVFSQAGDRWTVSLGSSEPEQITRDAQDERAAVFAPVARTIAFYSSRSGHQDIWLVPDAAAQTLSRLTIHARALDQSRVDVTAAYRVASAPTEGSLAHRAIVFPGQRVEEIHASSGGRELPFQTVAQERSLELRVDAAAVIDGAYELAYRVTSGDNPRFPVFVPTSFKVPPDSALDIDVQLAPGVTIVGDSFPRLRPEGGHFVANLVNVPSFLLLNLRPAGAVSHMSDWLTVGTFTNLTLFAIIVGASMYWWRLRRRALALHAVATRG